MTRVFDRCCLTGGRGHEQGRSAVGNRLALRVRAAICARVSLGSTASAPTKSHPAALACDTSSPNCYHPSSLAKNVGGALALPWRAARTPTRALARLASPGKSHDSLALSEETHTHRTHDRHADKTMRPPAGRGFGGGGRGFGGRGSPGGRGFGGRGGRGGRGGFDEGPPDTVVGAYHFFSFAFLARVSTGRRTRRAMPRSSRPSGVGLP